MNQTTHRPPGSSTPQPDPRRWRALVVLCLALALVSMESLITNVTLPTLVTELGASTSQLQWVVDAYTLVFAGAVLSMGSVSDRFGRRRALYAGLSIFLVGSVASTFAGSPGTLVAGRAVMGLGGALVCPATLSIVTHTFPVAERGRALAYWSSFSALGILIGPPVGGWLIEHYWWGSIYLINVPAAAALLVAVRRLVPESRDTGRTPLDPLGALLSAAGLVAVVYGIIEVPTRGWADARTLTAFAVGTLLVAAFVGWQRRAPHPLLPLQFFANPRFTAANAAMTLMFLAMAGMLFALTQHLQGVLAYSPFIAGLAVLPAASMVVSAPFTAGLVRRFGTKAVVTAGMVAQGAGVLFLSTADADAGYPPLAVAMVAFGLGMGLAMPAATESIMNTLPVDRAGVGSAMNDTTRNVGSALGVAIIGSVLSAVYRADVASHLTGLPDQVRAAANGSLGGALRAADGLGADGGGLAAVARDAFGSALHASMLVAAGALLLGALVAALLLPSRDRADDHRDTRAPRYRPAPASPAERAPSR